LEDRILTSGDEDKNEKSAKAFFSCPHFNPQEGEAIVWVWFVVKGKMES
jgi:hypothetical protein